MSDTEDYQITDCVQPKSCQVKQILLLILSCVPPAALVLVLGQKLIDPDSNLLNPISGPVILLFVLLALITGVPTMFRVKRISVDDRAIHVNTWISRLHVPWSDVIASRKFSFGSLLVRCRQGCFLLGQELEDFERLSKLIASRTPTCE